MKKLTSDTSNRLTYEDLFKAEELIREIRHSRLYVCHDNMIEILKKNKLRWRDAEPTQDIENLTGYYYGYPVVREGEKR